MPHGVVIREDSSCWCCPLHFKRRCSCPEFTSGQTFFFWKWLVNPAIDLTDPGRILGEEHPAAVATDCKSVFDIATRTSTPSCEEYRTCLECLLTRERLKESCRLRWVSSRAQLADSLTKSMDGSLLKCLAEGRYSLFDEELALKERADRRNKLLWVKKDP